MQACNHNNVNIEQNAKSIAELNELLLGLSVQVSKLVANDGKESENVSNDRNHDRDTNFQPYQNRQHPFSARMTKVEFPKFDGTELRSWLYRCNQFFQIDEIPDDQKVRLAAIHLEGKALLWHQTYMQRCNNVMST